MRVFAPFELGWDLCIYFQTRWGYSAVTLSHGLELWLDAKDINNILVRSRDKRTRETC